MKKEKILKILFIVIFIVVILLFLFVLFNRYPKYDKETMTDISRYLRTNSFYIDDIYVDSEVEVDDKILNKIIYSYLISNVEANYEYNYDNARECYKYFSSKSNILFYDSDIVDKINKLFGNRLKRITQDDYTDFNTLYYNEKYDIYYVVLGSVSDRPNYILEFKEYKQKGRVMYFDYYYAPIEYIDMDNDDEVYINVGNLTNIRYYDLFNSDNVCISCSSYLDNFSVVRYEFSYDKSIKKYYLSNISRSK